MFRQEGGWSKQTLTFLSKMDSFMTECARVQPNAACKFSKTVYPLLLGLPSDWNICSEECSYYSQGLAIQGRDQGP